MITHQERFIIIPHFPLLVGHICFTHGPFCAVWSGSARLHSMANSSIAWYGWLRCGHCQILKQVSYLLLDRYSMQFTST